MDSGGKSLSLMTPCKCVAYCNATGHPLAGVYSGTCYCGSEPNKMVDESNCNTQCSGDSSKVCGGYVREVFRQNLKSLENISLFQWYYIQFYLWDRKG